MHSAAGPLGWIETAAISTAMREWLWLYPAVEIVHIFGFVIVVGSVAMFDLRVLGFSRHLSIAALGRHLLGWSVAGFALVVPAGLLMFSAHPDEFVSNPVFLFKLALIASAGLNAAVFHLGVFRSVEAWDREVTAPAPARLQATLSLLLWFVVITCGRLLAYT